MSSSWSEFGALAESKACEWLKSLQYKILDRNWKRPWGELDIVAQKDGVMHFIEVKASVQHHEGFEPFVRAGSVKMAKVLRTARTWLAVHHYDNETEWQIDIISVIMKGDTPTFELFEQIS